VIVRFIIGLSELFSLFSTVLRLVGIVKNIIVSGGKGKSGRKAQATNSTDNPAQRQTLESAAPPNLQLNLSSDHFTRSPIRKGHELFLAAATAVVLQTGLLAIAGITVYHEPTRDALGSAHKPWGLPCYIAGSILLSIGIGICARSVERSTVEKCYSIPGKWLSGYISDEERDSCPRLLWLQQNQTVNDQAFEGYVVLAGPKRRVVTSRRVEDPDKSALAERIAANRYLVPVSEARSSTTSNLWKGLTVIGVVAAGLGFISQFFGLRGLAFPCSVAQLCAILIMALVRSGIRRRLGRIPAHCSALPKYELDSLATHITFFPSFRNFYKLCTRNDFFAGTVPIEEFYRWEISAPENSYKDPRDKKGDAPENSKHHEMFYFVLPSDCPESSEGETGPEETEGPGLRDATVERPKATSPSKKPESRTSHNAEIRGPRFEAASSQQLLRVRDRLSNLCLWTSQATETAVSLVQSVELFMNTFLISKSEETFKKFNWVISTINPSLPDSSPSKGLDFIVIPVSRSDGNWTVDLGKVDAALSLWMATIEAKLLLEKRAIVNHPPGEAGTGVPATRKTSEWRRIKAATGMKLDFYRILGTDFEDGVLKRDLCWWVDELFAEQDSIDSPDRKSDDIDLVIGFSGRPGTLDPRRNKGGTALKDLGVISSAFLPVILAQHMFTSFMWNIAPRLPKNCFRSGYTNKQQNVEIEASDSFNPYEFAKTWHRPKLRHPQLIKIARQMETNGLGSISQSLFCMIPALSFHDLLPNHAVLKILPKVGRGQGWEETAHCYNQLLETNIRADEHKKERFCYSVVVDAMDFLYVASEPYSHSIVPPPELDVELKTLATKLASSKFAPITQSLAPIYDLQHRRRAFRSIFKRYLPAEGAGGSPMQAFNTKSAELQLEFFQDCLGFSDIHKIICASLKSDDVSTKVNKDPGMVYLEAKYDSG